MTKKYLAVLFLGLALGMATAGCVTVNEDLAPAQTLTMSSSPKIRLAEGKLVVSPTQYKSNMIDIVIKNMVRPERILPKARTYVVWEVPHGVNMKPQSIGALALDKKLTGRLTTATPFRQFDIFVTAEAKINQIEPSGEKLFWSTVGK